MKWRGTLVAENLKLLYNQEQKLVQFGWITLERQYRTSGFIGCVFNSGLKYRNQNIKESPDV